MESSGNCKDAMGKVHKGYRKSAGRLQENFRKTVGKLQETV